MRPAPAADNKSKPIERARHAWELQTQTRGLLPLARGRAADGRVLGLRNVCETGGRTAGRLTTRGGGPRRGCFVRAPAGRSPAARAPPGRARRRPGGDPDRKVPNPAPGGQDDRPAPARRRAAGNAYRLADDPRPRRTARARVSAHGTSTRPTPSWQAAIGKRAQAGRPDRLPAPLGNGRTARACSRPTARRLGRAFSVSRPRDRSVDRATEGATGRARAGG